MTSISSILSAAVCFNLLALSALAAENYSLWPRRPAELEQARRLVREQKGAEAAHLLQPFIHDNGIAGREARQIVGSVNVQRYLSRRHPDARVYTVKPGDNVFKIAAAEKCPFELIMLLNGIVEPAGLRVGQKLVLVPMNCRLEVRLTQREVCVWDGDTLVADYALSVVPRGKWQGGKTDVAERIGVIEGTRIPPRSSQFASADKKLKLANGMSISGDSSSALDDIHMGQRDLNELSLLLAPGASVDVKNSQDK